MRGSNALQLSGHRHGASGARSRLHLRTVSPLAYVRLSKFLHSWRIGIQGSVEPPGLAATFTPKSQQITVVRATPQTYDRPQHEDAHAYLQDPSGRTERFHGRRGGNPDGERRLRGGTIRRLWPATRWRVLVLPPASPAVRGRRSAARAVARSTSGRTATSSAAPARCAAKDVADLQRPGDPGGPAGARRDNGRRVPSGDHRPA